MDKPESETPDGDGEKETLLAGVRRLAARGLLTRSELLEAYRRGRDSRNGESSETTVLAVREPRWRLAQVFYFVGALIVFVGIGLLVWQNWTGLSRLSKILITLGSGSVTLGAAVALDLFDLNEWLVRALYYLAGLLLPLGLFITYYLSGYDVYSPAVVSQVTGVLFLLYLGLYQRFDRSVVLTLTIVFGSWFYYGVTEWVFVGMNRSPGVRFYHYRTLIVSIGWMMLARFTSQRRRPMLSQVLWGVGNLAFLSAGFALGGWVPTRYVVWELAFPFMVLFILLISVSVGSRISLVVSSLFLIAYLTRLTMKYFQDSFGWPLALVVLGFGVMSVGSVTYVLYDRLITD